MTQGPTTLGWFCQGASSGKVWTELFSFSHQPNSAAIRLGGADGLVYIRVCSSAVELRYLRKGYISNPLVAGSNPATPTLTPKNKDYGTGSIESWAQEYAHTDRLWCRLRHWFVFIRLRRPSAGEDFNPWLLNYHYMKLSEIRKLKIGDKYKAITPFCSEGRIRKIKFITYMNNLPYIIFYGRAYQQRNSLCQLLSDNYILLKRK